MINHSSIVVETVEIKDLRELRGKVNNIEKRLVDIDILEQRVIERSSYIEKLEEEIRILKNEKTVIKEKKYPDDLLCDCKRSVHYGKKYKEIKQLMDNQNYDFHAWVKRCPVNWVENVN